MSEKKVEITAKTTFTNMTEIATAFTEIVTIVTELKMEIKDLKMQITELMKGHNAKIVYGTPEDPVLSTTAGLIGKKPKTGTGRGKKAKTPIPEYLKSVGKFLAHLFVNDPKNTIFAKMGLNIENAIATIENDKKEKADPSYESYIKCKTSDIKIANSIMQTWALTSLKKYNKNADFAKYYNDEKAKLNLTDTVTTAETTIATEKKSDTASVPTPI